MAEKLKRKIMDVQSKELSQKKALKMSREEEEKVKQKLKALD